MCDIIEADDKFNGKMFKNVISKKQCDNIVKYAENTAIWERAGHEFWDNRVINIRSVSEIETYKIMVNAKEIIRKKIEEAYKITKPIYPDLLQIIRWFEGSYQPVHADAFEQDGTSNGFSWRKFGCIVYLNDDYEGGKTYYPKHNIEITPESGMLAIHLADLNHNHGVTKVSGKIRYTLVSFWGFDASKDLKL